MELDYRGDTLIYVFDNDKLLFRIEFFGSGDEYPIVDQGWRIYKVSWHKTRRGQPVKNRRPRWKQISTCSTKEEAIGKVKGLIDD